jgi:hypothetical protein
MERGHGYSSHAQDYALHWQTDATGDNELSVTNDSGALTENTYGNEYYDEASEPYTDGDWTLYYDENGTSSLVKEGK